MSAAGVAGRANQSNQGAERVAIGIRLTPGTMPGLLHSLGYTIRLLLKSPGFTVTAILIIGFGIGVNAAIFSIIDSVRLHPLPFPQANRLVKNRHATWKCQWRGIGLSRLPGYSGCPAQFRQCLR
jgi:hypothetical protein